MSGWRRRLIVIAVVLIAGLLVALLPSLNGSRSVSATILSEMAVQVGDRARYYRLVIPEELAKPVPAMIAFHGSGDSPESFAAYSRLDELADEHGFLLAYPRATTGMWGTVGVDFDQLDAHPDIQFFDALLEELRKSFQLDPQRIYVVGMSNGATFSQLLLAARSKQIAALAAHSGANFHDSPVPERMRPLLLIVGREDGAFPAMQRQAEQYAAEGHDVDFVSIPDWGHRWSTRHNAVMWEFLSGQKISSD